MQRLKEPVLGAHCHKFFRLKKQGLHTLCTFNLLRGGEREKKDTLFDRWRASDIEDLEHREEGVLLGFFF